MKKLFYITLTFVLAVFLISCEPIEKRESAGAIASASQVHLTAINTTTVHGKKGNQIVVDNSTASVYPGMWDLLIRPSLKKTDTVILPFMGKITLPYYAISAGGVVHTGIDVTIDTADHPVDPYFALLAGNTSAGKTWVWAGPNYPNRFAMTGGTAKDTWWSLSLDDIIARPAIYGGGYSELNFDLNGRTNCTMFNKGNNKNAVVSGLIGGFLLNLNSDPRTLTISGDAHIPGWDFRTITTSPDGTANAADFPIIKSQVYNIVTLNDTTLSLWMNLPATGQGWLWVFMPKK
jgi:hypothetical protein